MLFHSFDVVPFGYPNPGPFWSHASIVLMGNKHVIQWNDFHVAIKGAGDYGVLARCPVLHVRSTVQYIVDIGVGNDLECSSPCPKFISPIVRSMLFPANLHESLIVLPLD